MPAIESAMLRPELTILTLPIPDGPDALRQCIYLAGRWGKQVLAGKGAPVWPGHHAVTRSVVEGIAKAGLPVNYNPRRVADLAERVHVLAGVRPLRQMIELKRAGRVRQLTCGPNNVVQSSDCDSILASPEIDCVVNHTEWGCEFWAQEHPELLGRCLCWAAGVDAEYWQPPIGQPRNRILIFDKRLEDDDPERVHPYARYLRDLGWNIDIVTRCGSMGYTLAHYRAMLHRSCLMVGFTVGSESQGIAWAEAWAADVPTLILQQTENVYRGRRYRCSTAPFLTDATGLFFNDFEDFKRKFGYWSGNRTAFRPREWVLAYMSDEVSARNLFTQLMALPQRLPMTPF